MEQKRRKEELFRTINKDTRTIELLDEFEGIGDKNDTIYERLIIGNLEYIWDRECGHIPYRFVIERSKVKEYAGDITFTQFKKRNTRDLRDYIENEVTDEVVEQYKGKRKIFKFSKPFHLRAQNSLNRTGYGWEWDWTDGAGFATEGTLYGETTDYVFSGIYIE